MNTLERRSLVEGTNGSIFTADFIKKNGELRTMNCRLKVRKHLRGGISTTAHKENLVTVYDLQAQGYRTINLETLVCIRFNKREVFV